MHLLLRINLKMKAFYEKLLLRYRNEGMELSYCPAAAKN